MSAKSDTPRIETGVRNFDDLLRGGLPKGAVTVIAGPPGGGKTILAQQICFHNATSDQRALYFNTLSEPTAKTLRYLSQFSFFDAKKLEAGVEFVDLGIMLRTKGLEEAAKLIMEHVKRVKPAIVVLDSFKVFDDLAKSDEELRKFGYEIAVNLMAWEVTGLILGEYGAADIQTNPLFSIIDGVVMVTQREQSGEQQRFIQVSKMRGTDHSRDEHSFAITSSGIEVFAPRVTIRREPQADGGERCKTGISKFDELVAGGIPRGSSLLVSGVAGTGKTALALEFIYRGAKAGEKGIYFSFEETKERLRASAKGFGWDFDKELKRGMIELVFIPQPDIMVESHLLMMQERIEGMKARRVAVDSLSVFLHKVKDPQIVREKTFQLASIVQNTGAIGFLATDVPYGSGQISRFGVEETVVDGVILLSSTQEGFERQRYLEVYKLRNTAHLKGRHNMVVGPGGVALFPRYSSTFESLNPPPTLDTSRRLSTGVPGLDELLGGGLFDKSVTLVSGSTGIGKSTLGLHFVLEGATRDEPGLYFTLEEGPAQLLKAAEGLGLPLEKATKSGLVELVYLAGERIRANQLLAILTDKIVATKARRLVLDGVGHIIATANEMREVLFSLAARFKALGVTSLLTLEATSLYSWDVATERDFSPISDNLIMLRYGDADSALNSYVTIVKTRNSGHDRGRHPFRIERGGWRIEDLPSDASQRKKKPATKKKR